MNNRPFVFSMKDKETIVLIFVAITTKFEIKRNPIAQVLRIASVTSYLCENEAENLQNGDFHLAQIPDFGMR